MTELLYLEDCYITTFDATVVDVQENYVELDKTAFYPEGGGQPTDTGFLTYENKEFRVKKVKKDRGKVLHKIEGEIPKGARVIGKIDWEKRHCYMRYHTALHVLSKVLYNMYNAKVTGNQIHHDKARMDFFMENWSRENLLKAVDDANKIIKEGREVKLHILPRKDAEKLIDPERTRLDMIPSFIKEIRLVEIDNFDVEACGGTHVKNTKEIGEIKVLKTLSKGKEHKRVEISLATKD